LLLDGGQVFMPMQDTFYASRFAMLRDRFGRHLLDAPASQAAGRLRAAMPGSRKRSCVAELNNGGLLTTL
jgi:hypothetical protein